jgi:hypothetical protein
MSYVKKKVLLRRKDLKTFIRYNQFARKSAEYFLSELLETVQAEDMLVPNGQTRNASADSLIRFNRITVCSNEIQEFSLILLL